MKGLYVYGSLLMAMGFALGVYQHDQVLIFSSVLACGMAALGEALGEIYEQNVGLSAKIPNAVAMGSWVATIWLVLYLLFKAVA